MLKIDVRSDIAKVVSKYENIRRDQLPFAISKAVNETAKIVKAREQEEMPRVFDRPTPYTLNSLFVKFGNKRFPIAEVKLKDDAGKGTPASRYLLPQIQGGGRRHKRFERALSARGVLPSGMYAEPGGAAKMDAYGNMNRGQIVQILSALGAAEQRSGFLANRTKVSKKRKGKKLVEYFAAQPGNKQGLHPGVYLRRGFAWGSAIKPVLIFGKAPSYKQRYRFHAVAEATVRLEFPEQFRIAFERAIATAR